MAATNVGVMRSLKDNTSYLAWCIGAAIVIGSVVLVVVLGSGIIDIVTLVSLNQVSQNCSPMLLGAVTIPGFGGRCLNTTDCPMMYRCGPDGACQPESTPYANLTSCTTKRDCQIVGTRPSPADDCCPDGYCTHNGVCDVVINDGLMAAAAGDAAVIARRDTGCPYETCQCTRAPCPPRDDCCGPYGNCVPNDFRVKPCPSYSPQCSIEIVGPDYLCQHLGTPSHCCTADSDCRNSQRPYCCVRSGECLSEPCVNVPLTCTTSRDCPPCKRYCNSGTCSDVEL